MDDLVQSTAFKSMHAPRSTAVFPPSRKQAGRMACHLTRGSRNALVLNLAPSRPQVQIAETGPEHARRIEEGLPVALEKFEGADEVAPGHHVTTANMTLEDELLVDDPWLSHFRPRRTSLQPGDDEDAVTGRMGAAEADAVDPASHQRLRISGAAPYRRPG